jgi:hypothetical protein
MGLGSSAFGVSLFGLGGEASDPGNAFYLTPIRLPTRVFEPPSQIGLSSPLLADNIDPVTKDFTDLFIGMDPVDAAVQVAITTTRGSGACVFNVGLRISNNKLTSDFKRVTEADVRLALAQLVDRKDIEIAGVYFGSVDSNTDRTTGEVFEADASAQVNVKFVNLRAFDGRVRASQLVSGGASSGLFTAPPLP